MLKIIDGLRTVDSANTKVDFAQSVAAQVNATSVDMSNFQELLAVGVCTAVTGSGTGTIVVQESNESGANFTNITNAAMAFNAANTARVHSIDWRKATRKRYARLSAFNATNAIALAGVTLRCRPTKAAITIDANASQADS